MTNGEKNNTRYCCFSLEYYRIYFPFNFLCYIILFWKSRQCNQMCYLVLERVCKDSCKLSEMKSTVRVIAPSNIHWSKNEKWIIIALLRNMVEVCLYCCVLVFKMLSLLFTDGGTFPNSKIKDYILLNRMTKILTIFNI